jgi:mRNA-degrading endonuclease RelE of RelBE toxin-antitoxin system
MKSAASSRFRKLLKALPKDVRKQAAAAYRLFKQDPYHPSLHFKAVIPEDHIYSVRIGDSYRALGRREKDDFIAWFWIGSHADYDNLLRKR